MVHFKLEKKLLTRLDKNLDRKDSIHILNMNGK